MAMQVKRTSLYDIHKRYGAVLRPFAGFEMPIHYGSISAEHHAVRNKAGLFDVSHMSKFWVDGDGALPLLQYVCSNDASNLAVGSAQYTCLPNESGGIIDDAVLYRTGRQRYLFVGNASNREKDWNWIEKHNQKGEASLIDASEEKSILALQGPSAQPLF